MTEEMTRESMEYDVVIVGGGPAGLATAIRLRQLAAEKGEDISVCVLEKGSEIGAHLLSGAVFEPRALDELIPDWKDKGAPLTTEAGEDSFWFLTEGGKIGLPVPPAMHNKGNYIISLGELARWMAEQAEEMEVEIYPGFAAAEVLYHDDGSVKGVATGDMGVDATGKPTDAYEPGMELHARQTIFAEGCRGSLTRRLMDQFNLRDGVDPQVYGIGIKELWEIPEDKHEAGRIIHTIGWPMDMQTYGGSWVYQLGSNLVSIGFVVGLNYENPWLSPYEEMQRFKTHPAIRKILEGGRRVAYGSRAISAGGWQAIPKLTFPGGALVGDCAGFLNLPKIKGNHTAMKSGMLAAEAVYDLLTTGDGAEATDYRQKFDDSWLADELYRVRNVKPSFKMGLLPALAYNALDQIILRGKAPWTFHHKPDHEQLKPADQCTKIDYPKPDGELTFDRLTSVSFSNTNHAEEQPCHLTLKDPDIPITVNLAKYEAPEQRYCPAGVYEIVGREEGEPRLQINAQNCVHCKTCDIKDPTQNIVWVVPEGGGGPNYPNM